MKIKAVFTFFTLVAFLTTSLHAQDTKSYKHPIQNFSFSTSGDWHQIPNHKDKMIYEMVNKEKGVHVMLWYNGGTEMSCERYLVKMADMKGLEAGKPIKKEFKDKNIWILECSGKENDIKEKRIIAAMSYRKPYGKDAPERCQGKSYNAMHIAQV